MNNKHSSYIGKKLKDIAPTMDFNKFGVTVFLLENNKDTIGKRVANDYSLSLILMKDKALNDKKIIQAYDFYGESIFRVL